MMKAPLFLGVVAVLFCLSGPALAQGPIISFDENGNAIGAMSLGRRPDPTSGGKTTLAYQLPFLGTRGDVGIREAPMVASDLLRFTGDGMLFIYSDMSTADPANSLADVGFPSSPLSPFLGPFDETGPEGGINGLFNYKPTSGQPGFDSSGPTYNFISDGTLVPEPGSLTLLGIGALGLAGYAWRRRKQAAQDGTQA